MPGIVASSPAECGAAASATCVRAAVGAVAAATVAAAGTRAGWAAGLAPRCASTTNGAVTAEPGAGVADGAAVSCAALRATPDDSPEAGACGSEAAPSGFIEAGTDCCVADRAGAAFGCAGLSAAGVCGLKAKPLWSGEACTAGCAKGTPGTASWGDTLTDAEGGWACAATLLLAGANGSKPAAGAASAMICWLLDASWDLAAGSSAGAAGPDFSGSMDAVVSSGAAGSLASSVSGAG